MISLNPSMLNPLKGLLVFVLLLSIGIWSNNIAVNQFKGTSKQNPSLVISEEEGDAENEWFQDFPSLDYGSDPGFNFSSFTKNVLTFYKSQYDSFSNFSFSPYQGLEFFILYCSLRSFIG
jgi:hypothetical protein